MRKTIAVLLAAGVSLAFAVQPSPAQSGSFKTGRLEKVRMYMARPQIEILDETPIVKDRRTVDEEPTYEIAIPALPGRSGGGQGRSGGGGPNVIRLSPTGPSGQILGKPGFESNMGSYKAPAKQLPIGNTTGVHAKADLPGKSGPAPLPGSRNPGGKVGQSPASTPTAVYQDNPTVNVSGPGQRVSTDTHIKRLPPRGDLLRGK